MIRIRLINEGRVVKQITSRLHEGVVLEQVKNYKDPFDTIQIVEGELSEGAKDMLHHVARKIIPAAMAAGVAMSGAGAANAQGGANPNYPGLNHSVGQHMADIFSPNYKEAMRQREYQRSTERQVWNAEQNEIRKQQIADARARAGGGGAVQKHVIYDQSRLSKDGKSYIVYGIDNTVRRIPVAGTEYMAGDSQRLPHYITSGGAVLYVRHPHAVTEGYTVTRGIDKERYQERPGLEGPFSTKSGKVVYYDKKEGKYYDPDTDFYIGHEDYAKMDEDATVGTIPASGTTGTSGTSGSMSQRTQFAPTGKTTAAKFNNKGQIELDTDQEDDGSVNLDANAVKQLQQAGVQIKEDEHSPVAGAITRRILLQRHDLLSKYGPVLVMQAVDEVADYVGDVEEIGSSDVSGWIKQVEQMLTNNPLEAFSEGTDTLEGILSKFSTDYAKFKAGGDIDENKDFFQALYDYYSENGEMPYGVQKARNGDPYEWITDRLDQESGVDPVVEAEGDEATPGDQAAADQNIIMQIRKASDYEKPTKIELADGTESVIAPNIAKQLLAKFDKMKPESKALLQDTLNTEEGFKEILAYFGGGVREQAAARASKIMQSAMVEAGVLDDVRARIDARRDPPEKQSANPTTPLPPVPPYVTPESPTELKAGDIIGYRVPGSKMMPIKAKVLKLMRGGFAMVSVSSPRMIAQNNGSPVITIGPLDSLEIQNPFKAIAKNESVVNEAAEDWLLAYNALVKGNGEPGRGSGLLWQKVVALAAKDNGISGQNLRSFVLPYTQNPSKAKMSNTEEGLQLDRDVQAIFNLMQRTPTMDQMRDAVKQQASNQHQQNLTNINQQLDLENAPLQHELSVQALINKAELDRADQKELLELDMEARLAIIKIKQDLELDAKERLIALEREIEDRKEREDVRKHELELAQAGYTHELAVINATAEGEYKKAKLEADYQIQIKQLDNIDNAGERQNSLDQINAEKAKQLAVINAETKARVEVLQKEVDVEKQQNDARIEQAYMMAFMPIWSSLLDKASNLGKTVGQNISAVMGALGRLSKPIMPTAQKESRYGRRDAYQRDYDNSISGMGKKDSYAYQQDGGANDEDHAGDARREQQTQSGTWYIRLNGKLIRDKAGEPYTFRGKAAANKAALTMQAKLFNQGKEFMLTTNPNDKTA